MFSAEDSQNRLKEKPFRPVRIVASEGLHHDVFHSDLVLLGRRDLTIGYPGPDNPAIYESYEWPWFMWWRWKTFQPPLDGLPKTTDAGRDAAKAVDQNAVPAGASIVLPPELRRLVPAYLRDNDIPHVWHVDDHAHDPPHWKNSLYHFVQRIFRDSVAVPQSPTSAPGSPGYHE